MPPAGAGRPGRTTRTSCTWRRRTATPRSRRRTSPSTSSREYLDRIPHVERRDDGSEWIITEGNRPQLVKRARSSADRPGAAVVRAARARPPLPGAHGARGRPAQHERADDRAAPRRPGRRRRRRRADLPEQGPAVLGDARPRVRRRHVPGVEPLGRTTGSAAPAGGTTGRTRPLASIATGDVELAMAEATWAAEHGFVGLCLGNSPVYGPKEWGRLEYNDPRFEPFWALDRGARPAADVPRVDRPRPAGRRRQRRGDHQLRLPQHGDDDRAARAADHVGRVRAPPRPAGRPGRVRHRLRAVAAGDDGLRLPGPPHVGAAGDPRAAVDVLPPSTASPRSRRTTSASRRPSRHDLVGNLMWANDYPHHEGSWPYSAASIERQMSGLSRATPGRRSSDSTPSACSRSDARRRRRRRRRRVDLLQPRRRARQTEFQLACTAIRNAVADAGLALADVDGVRRLHGAQRAGAVERRARRRRPRTSRPRRSAAAATGPARR